MAFASLKKLKITNLPLNSPPHNVSNSDPPASCERPIF